MLIVGAGISGIGAGYHLQARCPDRSYLILEGRDAIGGTWDLFRYPGIRSDSDMYTLGYSFRPWTADQSIADGASVDWAAAFGREAPLIVEIGSGAKVLGPIRVGEVACVTARITAAFRTSVEVKVEVFGEAATTGERWPCVSAFVTFVAVDDAQKPVPVRPLAPVDAEDHRHLAEANERRALRLSRRKASSAAG